MIRSSSRSRRRRAALAGALLAAALLAPGSPVLAAGDALLAIHVAPIDADRLLLREVRVRLDGRELPFRLPALVEVREEPLVEVPTSSGPHTIDVEVRLDGHSELFTYVEPYRFTLRGHLDLHVRTGELVAVRVAVVRNDGTFLRWEDRHRLALAATSYRSERAGFIPPPIPDPPPVQDSPPIPDPPAPPPPRDAPPARVAAPAPAGEPARLADRPAACALEPVNFDFDQVSLGPRASEALDRFAACLGQGPRAIRVEGHCDLLGSDEANRLRGQQRADAVVSHLRQRGLTGVRFTAVSMGRARPLCGDATEACRARNRRVEAFPEP